MCEFCEASDPITPSVCDSNFNIEIQIDGYFNITSGERGAKLVAYDTSTDDEAWFSISYCPMCGRKLKEATE